MITRLKWLPTNVSVYDSGKLRTMSLAEYSFLDKTEDFECPICTRVLTAPVQTQCCGAVFCKGCINQWSSPTSMPSPSTGIFAALSAMRATSNSCCPHCRHSPLQFYDDKRTERMIKSLTVTCANHKSGCKWTGELRNLSNHLNCTSITGCDYQMIPCPRKCGENVLRSRMGKHSEDCIHRKVECKFCHLTGYYKIITSCHYDECPKVEISCPNDCAISGLLRSQLQEHLKQCPLQIVSCDYANAGCTQRMARKDIEVHKVTAMSQHLNLVNKKLVEVLEHMECKNHVAPIVMKMSNFSQQENWSSPCFYTHANGYRLQLKVTVRHNTYLFPGFLSISVVPIEGPFDEHLNWPMCCRVTIRLLNQAQNLQHHSVALQIERQRHDVAPHSVKQFLAYNKLTGRIDSRVQFLVKEALYFQVLVELLGDCQPKFWINPTLVLT